MKKQLLFAAAVLFSAGLILSGCKKDDTTPPSITLTGGDVSQNITDTYTEPGFTATDDEDGDISSSVSITGSVTNGSVGQYTLSYNVSDAAGNPAPEQTRVVTVKSDQLAGTYDVTDVVTGKYAGTYNYVATVTQSSAAYNKILISNFAGLGATVVVNATVSGGTITIASQNPTGMQDPGAVVGSGTVSGKNITSLTYSITYTSGGADNCNATYSNHQ